MFDKTGTLTNGSFNVVAVHAENDVDSDELLAFAAHAEAYSDHPIAVSVKQAYSGQIHQARISEVREEAGRGVAAIVDEREVLVGNDKLMAAHGASFTDCELVGTILHVAIDGTYVGHIVIADVVKPDAAETIERLHAAGVRKTVMLTGDRAEVAQAVAEELGIDEFHAQLLPADKVEQVERLLAAQPDGANWHSWATASTTRPYSRALTWALPWAPWGRTRPSKPPTWCSWTTSRRTSRAPSAWRGAPCASCGRTSCSRWALSS
ncbi:MAG: HAD-IC family P-type ATPase [Senegalimassilia faecalis]